MSIYIGDKEIKDLYIGDSSAKEVYLGDVKVRPSISLKTYEEIVAMATSEGEPRANTRAELNSHPDEYVDYLDSEGKIYWQVTPRALGTVNGFGTGGSTMYPKGSWMIYQSSVGGFCYFKKTFDGNTEDCS